VTAVGTRAGTGHRPETGEHATVVVDDWMARAARADGVGSRLAAARDAVDALLRDRGHRRTSPRMTREALFRGAVASAALEGSLSTAADVRAGHGDRVVVAMMRMYAELLSLAPTVRVAPLQAVARLHALSAAGLEADASLGRLREVSGLASQMQRLGRSLVAPTDVPAIAVAGLAHAAISTLRPFESMNGAVGRAVERLVLATRGLDPASVLVPEAGHLRLEDQYREALRAMGDEDPLGDPTRVPGLRRYLLHTADAVTLGVEESPLRATP
jgi:hypothetical protein